MIEHEKFKGDFVTRFSNAILKAFTGGKLSILESEVDIDFSSFRGLTSPEQEEIKRSLTELIQGNDYFVLIDNLDEPWKNNDQMNSWLRGLILSMRQLKREFKNLKVITFLRDDIYDEIAKGSDLFDSENEVLRIKWKDNNNFSLRQLLATRISTYLQLSSPENLVEFDGMWSKLYPLKLNYGQNTKFLSTYLIERTFSRPREFLQFCRLIIEKSQKDKLPVPEDAIHIAEREYSNWKVRDLVGEYSKTYDNIEKCILSFAGASNNWRLSYEDIKKHYELLFEEQKIFNRVKESFLPLDESIELLYKSGFFRKVITKQNQGKPKYLTSIDEKFINVKTSIFDIHHAFRKKLYEI